ncbi:sulfite exporter TauE/SafE family protein [uncultured Sulfitobacter sp.]|uniref:sulfite exporter TauE/SafE family protein n=1 Tax=uncultured Sulfitobacter sp. TaxID=191468 RepID=UPI0030D85281|tara:strand:- start:48318 stop:49073 length:756 start_codon:yes stop_codon:yes gene_type:complete
MPEILATAGSTTGLIWLLLTVIIAGLVRGFAGFGSAMIIMPVAASILSPVQAVIFLTAAELLGPLPNLPSALRQGTKRDITLLLAGVVLAMPLGLLCLSYVSPDPFGWIVSGVVITLLVLLITGWRYSGAMGTPLIIGTGALGGFMTGFAGIAGPPVIMLYMASKLPIAVIRANFLLYLVGIDLLLFAMLWLSDLLVWQIVVLGLLMGIPSVLANMIGARLFDPSSETLFRTVAYIVIGLSAIIGLPLWKG